MQLTFIINNLDKIGWKIATTNNKTAEIPPTDRHRQDIPYLPLRQLSHFCTIVDSFLLFSVILLSIYPLIILLQNFYR